MYIPNEGGGVTVSWAVIQTQFTFVLREDRTSGVPKMDSGLETQWAKDSRQKLFVSLLVKLLVGGDYDLFDNALCYHTPSYTKFSETIWIYTFAIEGGGSLVSYGT